MDFCKFAFFSNCWGRAQGLFINVSNVIDLYHNKKIGGGGQFDPPRQPVSKPDVRLNRVKNFASKFVHLGIEIVENIYLNFLGSTGG